MANKGKIEIRIIKTEYVDISKLEPFQGKLKTLSKQSYNKLRKVIIEEGFCFALHVWETADVTYIIDGHQRVAVMNMMRKTGYDVPPIPCNFIKANTFHDAKKLVLLAVSQYGKLDKEGFETFVDSEDFNMDDFDFPDIDSKFFDNLEEQPEPKKGEMVEKEEYLIVIECDNEGAQSDMFEQLKEAGVKCKIM